MFGFVYWLCLHGPSTLLPVLASVLKGWVLYSRISSALLFHLQNSHARCLGYCSDWKRCLILQGQSARDPTKRELVRRRLSLTTKECKITNPKWLVTVPFSNSSGVVWTENIWCVFRVKPPFSNSSSTSLDFSVFHQERPVAANNCNGKGSKSPAVS